MGSNFSLKPPILERRTGISLCQFADCLQDLHALLLEAWQARHLWDTSHGAGNFPTPDDTLSSSILDSSAADNVSLAHLANHNPQAGNVRQPYATGVDLHAVAVKYSKTRYAVTFEYSH